MYLLYMDESGKSGLHDPNQPFFVLGGLAVHDSGWLDMESDLNERIDRIVGPERADDWEIHMTEIEHGKGWFKHLPRSDREELRDSVLDVLDLHEPTLFMVVIDKERLRARQAKGYARESPEEIAYCYMIERFNYFLGRKDGEVGVMVSDEQKGDEDTIRRAHSLYRREGTAYVVADRVVETPFFVPSHWSRMLQIIDVATWICNRSRRRLAQGGSPPPQWYRLEPHLDRYPDYDGKGLKVFPR